MTIDIVWTHVDPDAQARVVYEKRLGAVDKDVVVVVLQLEDLSMTVVVNVGVGEQVVAIASTNRFS